MNSAVRFGAQVLAVDLGTVVVFATLHQVFIALSIGPYGAALFGIIPAIPVVWAWNTWGRGRPASWRLGFAAASCGALPWLFVFTALWGTSDDPSGLTRSVAAALAAGVLAGGLTYASTRRGRPAIASALALFLTFFFTGAFMLTAPVSWVDVRALGCLVAGIIGGMVALAWATRRLDATAAISTPLAVPA